ncbi:ADP-ribosylglycohydrolase family protein [Haliangium ochraceum]|uniref:ADP-ribosylation/Crystallin J1 n=1 Tax=Haliangium ochraceum (strain DSM 14365 / JCM 11303 / SMP-2) TaxID=502025 RepID=D0LQC6_HALO1|nr:ADP-ribosylglycohydrolase family protein [Haliangium ochraceum]ACY18935.1 ADP-ribosylation/Crystallin J1 [Haliangium ochraceum DSM 14365]
MSSVYPIGLDADRSIATAPPAVHRGRGRGVLLGLCVGDALGTTLEFTKPSAVPLPTLVEGPHRSITGRGPFNLLPGQVTDDTHMACCLGASLMHQGEFDVDDIAARYLGWRLYAFDIGQQTTASLSQIVMGVPPEMAGHEVWLESNRQAAGNGSLMRTAPIGVFLADSSQTRRTASLRDSAITHFDPRCQLACASFNAAIAEGVTNEPDPYRMTEMAGRELRGAARVLLGQYREESQAIRAAEKQLLSDLDAAADSDPRLYGPELHLLNHAGYVRVAYRLAFWHLLHTRSFEDALVDVVNRGGDADTNGAITGALLGAVYGAEGIPQAWRSSVLEALPEMAEGAGPLASAYHPRLLLRMVPGDDNVAD